MISLGVILTYTSLLAVAVPQQSEVGEERRQLQGAWVLVGGEELGLRVAPDQMKERRRSTRWEFDGEVLKVAEGGESREVRYSLNLETSPKQMDVVLAEGPPTLLIYELDGDTLRLAFDVSVDGPGRPTSFDTGGDTVVLLMRREPSSGRP